MKKYFAIGFIMVALVLVLPTFVKAENVSTSANINTSTSAQNLMISSQQQLNQLLEQINKLQAELSRLQGEVKKVGEQIEKLTKILKLGTEGKEVEILQKFLKQDPGVYPEGKVTGYYGPLTEKAVKKFQEKNGLESIGIVGPKTMTKINEIIEEKEESKISICHIPPENDTNKQTITISKSALETHLAHGDIIGACFATQSPMLIACTTDAKLCPNGSYVSRVGPKCEFAPCSISPTPILEPALAPAPTFTSAPIPSSALENFAKCLTGKGAVLYSASWCSYCLKQADLFRGYFNFRYISQIDCSVSTQLCQEKGIIVYPTWTFLDGNKLYGVQDLVTLSKYTNCALPEPLPSPEAPTIAPVSTLTPFIKVIYPNGGETWYMGKTYDILWKSSGVEKVYIAAKVFKDSVSVGSFGIASSADNVSAASGRYSWMPNSRHLLEGNQIKIEVSNTEIPASGVSTPETLPSDESDSYFSILNSAATAAAAATIPVPILNLPDLIIEKISVEYTATGIASGPAYRYYVYVKNIGNAPAPKFALQVSLEPKQPQAVTPSTNEGVSYFWNSVSGVSIPNNDLVSGDYLNPGETDRFTTYFNPTENSYVKITAVADVYGTVNELDEKNNYKSENFYVNKVYDLPPVSTATSSYLNHNVLNQMASVINALELIIEKIQGLYSF